MWALRKIPVGLIVTRTRFPMSRCSSCSPATPILSAAFANGREIGSLRLLVASDQRATSQWLMKPMSVREPQRSGDARTTVNGARRSGCVSKPDKHDLNGSRNFRAIVRSNVAGVFLFSTQQRTGSAEAAEDANCRRRRYTRPRAASRRGGGSCFS
jgi:hypothetical protein